MEEATAEEIFDDNPNEFSDSNDFTDSEEQQAAEPSDDVTGEQAATPADENDEGSEAQQAEPEPSKRQVPLSALEDERRKRQELELQVARFQGRQEAQQPEKPKGPTREELEAKFYEDPVGFHEAMRKQEREVAKAEAAKVRIAASEQRLLVMKDDAQEKVEAFQKAAEENPSLWQQMNDQPEPAFWAYKVGADYLKAKEAPIDEAKIREDERKKVLEELKAQGSGTAVSTPKTNAGARGAGVGAAPAWSGPPTTQDVWGR